MSKTDEVGWGTGGGRGRKEGVLVGLSRVPHAAIGGVRDDAVVGLWG